MNGIITIVDLTRYESVGRRENNPIRRNMLTTHPATKMNKSDFFGNLYKSKMNANNVIDNNRFKLLRLKLNSILEIKNPVKKVDLLKKIQYIIIAKIGRKL